MGLDYQREHLLRKSIDDLTDFTMLDLTMLLYGREGSQRYFNDVGLQHLQLEQETAAAHEEIEKFKRNGGKPIGGGKIGWLVGLMRQRNHIDHHATAAPLQPIITLHGYGGDDPTEPCAPTTDQQSQPDEQQQQPYQSAIEVMQEAKGRAGEAWVDEDLEDVLHPEDNTDHPMRRHRAPTGSRRYIETEAKCSDDDDDEAVDGEVSRGQSNYEDDGFVVNDSEADESHESEEDG